MTEFRLPQPGQPEPISDELLSAYLDNAVSADERAQVEQALNDSPDVLWRLQSLRHTVQLIRALPLPTLPRAFTLESILAEAQGESLFQVTASAGGPSPVVPALQAAASGALADTTAAHGRAPAARRPITPAPARGAPTWGERLRAFWQAGSLPLRNAAAAAFALFLVVLAGGQMFGPLQRMGTAAAPPVIISEAAMEAPAAAAPAAQEAAPAAEPSQAVAAAETSSGAETAASAESSAAIESAESAPVAAAPAPAPLEGVSIASAPAPEAPLSAAPAPPALGEVAVEGLGGMGGGGAGLGSGPVDSASARQSEQPSAEGVIAAAVSPGSDITGLDAAMAESAGAEVKATPLPADGAESATESAVLEAQAAQEPAADGSAAGAPAVELAAAATQAPPATPLAVAALPAGSAAEPAVAPAVEPAAAVEQPARGVASLATWIRPLTLGLGALALLLFALWLGSRVRGAARE